MKKRDNDLSLGMDEEQFRTLIKAYKDPKQKRAVAMRLALSLLRVNISDRSLKRLIDRSLKDLSKEERNSDYGRGISELVKAVIYGACGSALHELVSMLWEMWPSGGPESIYPELPVNDLPFNRTPTLLTERALVREEYSDVYSELIELRGEIYKRISLDSSINESDIISEIKYQPRIKEVLRLRGYMQNIEVFRHEFDHFYLEIEEEPCVLVSVVSAAGSAPVSREDQLNVANVLEEALRNFGIAGNDYGVDLSSFHPLDKSTYWDMRHGRHFKERKKGQPAVSVGPR